MSKTKKLTFNEELELLNSIQGNLQDLFKTVYSDSEELELNIGSENVSFKIDSRNDKAFLVIEEKGSEDREISIIDKNTIRLSNIAYPSHYQMTEYSICDHLQSLELIADYEGNEEDFKFSLFKYQGHEYNYNDETNSFYTMDIANYKVIKIPCFENGYPKRDKVKPLKNDKNIKKAVSFLETFYDEEKIKPIKDKFIPENHYHNHI